MIYGHANSKRIQVFHEQNGRIAQHPRQAQAKPRIDKQLYNPIKTITKHYVSPGKFYDRPYNNISQVQNQEQYIFLHKYKILSNKTKHFLYSKNPFRLSSQMGFRHQVKYKKLQKGINKSVRSKKNQGTLAKFTCVETVQNIELENSNQFQRPTQQNGSQAKVNNDVSSTKTASNAFFHSIRQPDSSKLNKDKEPKHQIRQQSNILLGEICGKPIVQEHQSSNSKTSRNHSGSSRSSKNTQNSIKSSLKNSLFLPIHSLRNSMNTENNGNTDELEGYMVVEEQLEVLNVLANYTNEITQNYENTEEWEQLIFLTYKKYYIHRLKLHNALFYRNILFFERPTSKLLSATKKSLKAFMNSPNGEALRKQILRENAEISNSLRNVYNIIMEKSGNFINLIETDNFSCEIYWLMVQEIEELKHNFYKEPEIVKARLKSVVKCAMVIARLDCRYEEETELGSLGASAICMELFDRIHELIKLKLM